MPRVATGGGGSSSAAETGIGGSGLPTTVEGISSNTSGGVAKFDYMIFLYSGAAACTADAVAFPFDTAKTRYVNVAPSQTIYNFRPTDRC